MLKAVANTPNAANAIGPGGASGVTPLSIAKSAVAVSGANDTNENTLATITIPAGALGTNGFVRLHTLWSFTNNANNKTLRIRYSGAAGTQYLGNVFTTQLALNATTIIGNRNSASSQVGSTVAISGAATAITVGANATSSVDTSVATTIVVTGQKASAGDTLTLDAYMAEIVYGA